MERSVPLRNTPNDYGAVARTLHWLIVALLIAQFTLGWIGADLPVSLRRLVLLARHKSLGATIFMLVIARLGWRLYSPPPALPGDMPRWQRVGAHASHWMMYALLLAMPIVGWLSSSASNLTVSWWGLFNWPDLVAPDETLAHTLKAFHKGLGWLLLAVVSVHVAAALWHHFARRDQVLSRMIPWLPRRREQT